MFLKSPIGILEQTNDVERARKTKNTCQTKCAVFEKISAIFLVGGFVSRHTHTNRYFCFWGIQTFQVLKTWKVLFFYKYVTTFYIQKNACSRSARTFAALFHQPNYNMRILAFLLLFQSFASCQQHPEIAVPVEVGMVSLAVTTNLKSPEKYQPRSENSVLQSTDGGQTWQEVNAGLPEDFRANGVFAHENQIFLSSEKGLYRNSTASLAPRWEKVIFLNEKITDIFPGRAGVYALSYWNGIFQEILPDVWEPVYPDLKNQSVRTILETSNGAIFVGCDSGIFKSADNGKTWKRVFSEGMVLNMVESNGVLVAGGARGLLRSADGGEHWNWVLTEGGVGIETAHIQGRIAAITYNGETETRRLRTSADNGKTWQPIDAGLSPSLSISNVKQMGEHLFCSHPTGIFRSADQGKTWILVLPAAKDTKFYFAVSSSQVLYAIVGGFGC